MPTAAQEGVGTPEGPMHWTNGSIAVTDHGTTVADVIVVAQF